MNWKNPVALLAILSIPIVSVSLSAASLPPLVDLTILGEDLHSQNYDHLRESLRKDAASLASHLSGEDLVETLQNEEIKTRLLLLAILNKLPAAAISDREWTAEHQDFLNWLFLSPDRLANLLNELRPEDDAIEVLSTWAHLWEMEKNPEFREKYASLALALALIYDKPANAQENKDYNNPSLTLDERYLYFVEASESHKLDTSCHKLTPRELIRVVDLKISRNEIDWSLKKVRQSRKTWGNTYDDIEYIMERAVNNENPYSEYILSEILDKGGVCRDQAHYSAESGKARGIPVTYVHGTSDRGPHAWVEFMPEKNTWTSYGSQGIINGFVYDPQRGKTISSRLMWLESSKDYEAKTRVPTLLLLELARAARTNKKWESTATLLHIAERKAPLVVDIWQEKVALTSAMDGQPDQWKKLLSAMERNYKNHANILEDIASIRQEYLLPTLDEDEMFKALESEIRRTARKNGSEGDLVSDAISSLAAILVEKKSGDGLRKLYRSCFRKYGEDLEMFEKMMNSYQSYGSKLPEVASEIPSDLERFYKRHAESSTKEYFRGSTELSLYQRVAAAYRRAQNIEEADSITKKIERRKKSLARRAL